MQGLKKTCFKVVDILPLLLLVSFVLLPFFIMTLNYFTDNANFIELMPVTRRWFFLTFLLGSLGAITFLLTKKTKNSLKELLPIIFLISFIIIAGISTLNSSDVDKSLFGVYHRTDGY